MSPGGVTRPGRGGRHVEDHPPDDHRGARVQVRRARLAAQRRRGLRHRAGEVRQAATRGGGASSLVLCEPRAAVIHRSDQRRVCRPPRASELSLARCLLSRETADPAAFSRICISRISKSYEGQSGL